MADFSHPTTIIDSNVSIGIDTKRFDIFSYGKFSNWTKLQLRSKCSCLSKCDFGQ